MWDLLVLSRLLLDHDTLVTTRRSVGLIVGRALESGSSGSGLLLCKCCFLLCSCHCEQWIVLSLGSAVGATSTVTEGEVLAVIASEEKVVKGVMRWTVDDLFEWRVADHVRVVDQDTPKVDENEEADRNNAVEREDEGEDVVRQRLSVAVERVEGVAGVRCRDEPLVVWLVDVLVESGVVLESVNPVNEEIGEHQEKRNGKHCVAPAVVRNIVVELAVSSNFQHKPWDGQEVKWQESAHGRLDLETDLVLEEAWVLLHLLVEDVFVGETGKGEVENEDTDVGKD